VLCLYGDESHFDTAVTYGLVLVQSELLPAVEQALIDVKLAFGGTADSRIHCRQLFHPDARAKTDWRSLRTAEVFEMFCMLGNGLRMAGASFRVGHVDMLDVESYIFGSKVPNTTPTGPKQLATFAYVVALAGLEQTPGHANFRLWTDPDPTRVEWVGKRRQAGRHPFSMEFTGPLVPEPIVGPKPVLIDVADVVAFCAAHVYCDRKVPDIRKYGDAFNSFSMEYRKMIFHPQVFQDAPWRVKKEPTE